MKKEQTVTLKLTQEEINYIYQVINNDYDMIDEEDGDELDEWRLKNYKSIIKKIS